MMFPSKPWRTLDVTMDQTDNDGAHYIFGGNNADSPFAWTVGTHNAFVKLQFRIADVSGTDDCAFGFAKVQTATANLDDHTDGAFINSILGDIKIETMLNNAATVTVDTTQDWADLATHTFEVQVAQDRTTRFFVDGAFPTVTKGFLWDVGDVVIPIHFFLQATTTPGICEWLEFESGYLPKRR